jgi:flagellar biosynthesis/type III secretory pathway chaperone
MSPMKMNAILDQLLSVLNQETVLYRTMLTVIDKEEAAVMRSALNPLNEAGMEKENILKKLRTVEEQRCLLVRKLSEILGYPYRDLTLSKISQLVDEPFAGRLKQVSTDLAVLLDRLRRANRRNHRLITHSLELLRGSFNLLGELMASNTVYYRTGNIQSANATGQWVRSEI